ncbi:MAG: VWA domain-containing protein [Pseudomonadota bacterium]
MSDFHFLRPWYLVLLLVLVPILIMLWRSRLGQNNWQHQCDPHLLPHLLSGKNSRRKPWGYGLITLAALLTVLALAGPTWSYQEQPVYFHSNARVIVLDVSASMNAQDVKPSRLERAKYKILDLLNEIKEGQTGMLVFSRQPFVVSPLTEDSHTIASMVPVLDSSIVPVQGRDIATAIDKAAQLLQQDGANSGNIIVITDGSASNNAIEAAKKAYHEGYKTSVLGIGSTTGAPIPLAKGGFMHDARGDIMISKLNTGSLENLANAGDGNYIAFTNNNSDINSLLKATDARHLDNTLKESSEYKKLWQDQGHWLVWLLICIALLAFRRGWLENLTS